MFLFERSATNLPGHEQRTEQIKHINHSKVPVGGKKVVGAMVVIVLVAVALYPELWLLIFIHLC